MLFQISIVEACWQLKYVANIRKQRKVLSPVLDPALLA